jgi:hypothetical protein
LDSQNLMAVGTQQFAHCFGKLLIGIELRHGSGNLVIDLNSSGYFFRVRGCVGPSID